MARPMPVITSVDELIDYFVGDDEPPRMDELQTGLSRVGRNAGPAVLASLYWEGLLTEEVATATVGDVWSGAEFPENLLERDIWLELFELAGFTIDGKLADPPTQPIRLYRGCSAPWRERMSWTSDLAMAEWYANRPVYQEKGTVWTAMVEPGRLLCANLDAVGGRGESEYVINPDGLRITSL